MEEVHFIRDEMTNHVWAIEVNLSDKLGDKRDGQYAAKSFTDYLKQKGYKVVGKTRISKVIFQAYAKCRRARGGPALQFRPPALEYRPPSKS